VTPTLFTEARSPMRISQEEIFGPVLTAIPFADEAEALQIANDVRYGLTAHCGPAMSDVRIGSPARSRPAWCG
jgi:acyl-CoA reductase-like NAD-dependent aldehyde dehydrogenase